MSVHVGIYRWGGGWGKINVEQIRTRCHAEGVGGAKYVHRVRGGALKRWIM